MKCLLLRQCPPPEKDEICRKIGIKLLNHNEELWTEFLAWKDIYESVNILEFNRLRINDESTIPQNTDETKYSAWKLYDDQCCLESTFKFIAHKMNSICLDTLNEESIIAIRGIIENENFALESNIQSLSNILMHDPDIQRSSTSIDPFTRRLTKPPIDIENKLHDDTRIIRDKNSFKKRIQDARDDEFLR